MHRRHVLSAALAVVAPLAIAAAPPAHASTTAPVAPRLVGSRQAPMTIAGFDLAQVARAGNHVTTDAGVQVLRDGHGVELARVAGAGSSKAMLPDNTVYGNCGSSFFYLYDLSGAAFAMRTGFNVTSSAIDFSWHTHTLGQNSFQTDNWEWSDYGPMWPSTSWTSGYQKSSQDTYAGTYYYGRVTSGTAYLWNGSICVSGYPNAGIYLYK